MKKIINLFQRNFDGDGLVRDEIVPGSEWVFAGEGVATRKWDGTCCMIREGKLYKRYTLKPGRTAPPEFEPATGLDANTGKQEGWVPVGDGPEDQPHREAMARACRTAIPEDGTFELVGPKVQGNPEGEPYHVLYRHGSAWLEEGTPRYFNHLKEYFEHRNIEGIVWHHPDGRMVKSKGKDFGIKRGAK